MSSLRLSLADGVPGVSGANLTWVIAVAVVALLALVGAGVLVRQVLAASTGTEKMQEIAQAGTPAAASMWAMPRPTFWPAPVTSARRPLRSIVTVIPHLLGGGRRSRRR